MLALRLRRLPPPVMPRLLLDPSPRTAEEIFAPPVLERLHQRFTVVAREACVPQAFYAEHLPTATFVVGQPALDTAQLRGAAALRGIINVEGNFLPNLDYEACFAQGVHVLNISPVFAQPVAELALGLALALARDIPAAHQQALEGRERYGLDGNRAARTLHGCRMGFIGFGDLGRAILRVFAGLSPQVLIHDPWLSPDQLARDGLRSASLDEVLASSDLLHVVASVTDANRAMLGAQQFARLPRGAMLLLLSRAEVVDFEAMLAACASGHIKAATDVFPEEPLPADHAARRTPNLLLSAHRAGALESALFEIGERTLADLELMAAGLPPQNCKRAERELVGRLNSRPVARS